MPFATSHPELHDLIRHSKLHQGLVRQIAALLPEDDAALDALIGETVATHDSKAFNCIVVAALSGERPVQSRHLVGGTTLTANMYWLCTLAWKMQGEVAEHLLEALTTTVMTRELSAAAMLIAAAWSIEYREGKQPPELIRHARETARHKELNATQISLLWAIAGMLDDASLAAVLRAQHPETSGAGQLAAFQAHGKATLALCHLPANSQVPENPDNLIGSGPHVRRAVARIGRNDPCPCGSGSKYKRCCEQKDRGRMRELSDVSGKTRAEVMAEPEPHLTEAKLKGMPSYEVARLDVMKIPPKLLTPYLRALDAGFLLNQMAEAFEKLGCETDELKQAWDHLICTIGMKKRLDLAQRMVTARYKDGPVPDDLLFRIRLLLASEDPVRYAEVLEHEAREALTSSSQEVMMEFAYALLHSRYPFTGVHCARGIIPLINKKHAAQLLHLVEITRDRLGLPPEEPMAELLEKRFAEEVAADGKDAEELRKARERLETKAGEVNELKEKMEKLRREIRLQEKKTPPAAPTQAVVEAPELRELREKVRTLKSSIAERNNERAAYRRELGQAYADLQALREQQAAAAASNGSASATTVDAEDALLLPGEIDTNQPPRQIEFPRRFQDTLNHLPRQVGRAALMLIGRIAAGDPAAFSGAIRLSAKPDVMRVRVGMEHRMLFRLLPECVQLVALINRRDLDKTIASI